MSEASAPRFRRLGLMRLSWPLLVLTVFTLLAALGNVVAALAEHPELPPELVSQVDLDRTTFISSDQLAEVLSRTDATAPQVEAAVAVNEEVRLGSLKLGLLILAALSALAVVPASRLPGYLPEELPESVATGADES